ncbi:MAG: cobalamin biosynthesis protein CobQ [Thermoplasmata archaeon]|nr:MAG: cobalamin biosynthesis protein CobQ [Thermoplasmata archaeon]
MMFAITGGKGGTGKSTIATNLAVLLAEEYKTVLLDADVEEPNDFILLNTRLLDEKPVETIYPEIISEKCTYCMKCSSICPENAIVIVKGRRPIVFDRICSGCGLCFYECPEEGAMIKRRRIIGHTYVSTPMRNLTLVTGKLVEGEERAYPVILSAKDRAISEYKSTNARFLIVDTSAGTSNSVAASLKGCEFAIAVTEPTPLGAHDLDLILTLLERLSIRRYVIVNRSGIGPEDDINKIAREHDAEIIGKIPYSEKVIESYVNGVPFTVMYKDSKESKTMIKIAELIMEGSL